MRKIYKNSHLFLMLFPIAFLFVVFIISNALGLFTISSIENISVVHVLIVTLYSLTRIIIAYFLSLVVALVLAIWITSNKTLENILLPVFDVLESVPILAFFPIIIDLFLDFNFSEGAALFILFITMLWSILFTVVGGIKLIPEDITSAAKVYGIKGFNYFRYVLFPAVIPEMITGSILSFAAAWNIIIVAEVLHLYISEPSEATDLIGLGSLLVNANQAHDMHAFFLGLIVMTIVITFINIFVWQKLLRYAERFKFE